MSIHVEHRPLAGYPNAHGPVTAPWYVCDACSAAYRSPTEAHACHRSARRQRPGSIIVVDEWAPPPDADALRLFD